VHRRFQGWCCKEILRRVLTDVANELRDKGALDEEECFIDATFVMAKGRGPWFRRGRLLIVSPDSSCEKNARTEICAEIDDLPFALVVFLCCASQPWSLRSAHGC
jgi:hypothetical protein